MNMFQLMRSKRPSGGGSWPAVVVLVALISIGVSACGSPSAQHHVTSGISDKDSMRSSQGVPLSRGEQSARELANELTLLIDPRDSGSPAAAFTGYSSLRMNSARTALTLFWVEDVPDSVKEVIARYPQVHVDVQAAAFSSADTRRAEARIFDAVNTRHIFPDGVTVWTAGATPDGSGIDVLLGDPDGELTQLGASQELSKLVSIPVTVTLTESPAGGTTAQ